jgi:hypothetical protein
VVVPLPGIGTGVHREDRKHDQDEAQEGDNVHFSFAPFQWTKVLIGLCTQTLDQSNAAFD